MSGNKPSAQERATAVWQRKQVRQRRKTVQEKFDSWLHRRNKLVADMVAAASWSIQPYINIADADDNKSRWCLALSSEQVTRFRQVENAMASELLTIRSDFSANGEKVPVRSCWLPVFLPSSTTKVSFTIHDAYRSFAAERMVDLVDGDDKLNLTAFIESHGWIAEKTTIRAKSGYRMPAHVWYDGAANELLQSNCVVLTASAEEAVRMVSPASLRNQKRIDAIKPAATWGQFEFLYYPGGRPTCKPGKPKAPVPKKAGLFVITGGKRE